MIRRYSLNGKIQKVETLSGSLSSSGSLSGAMSTPRTIQGTRDYDQLENKPQINSVTLSGNKSGKQLALVDEEDSVQEWEIDRIVYGGF